MLTMISLFRNYRQKESLLFLGAIFFLFLRNAVFAIVRYGNLSRFFVFSVRFPVHFTGGLVYAFLVFASHLLFLLGIYAVCRQKVSRPVLVAFLTISVYSVGFYMLLMNGIRPSWIPDRFYTVTWLSVVPILSSKGLILLCSFFLAIFSSRSKLIRYFLLVLSTGLVADGVFFAFDFYRSLTLVIAVFFPYFALLFIIPGLNSSESIAELYDLDDSERSLAQMIQIGRSNKEIAFELGISLSKTKHQISALYRKCGIASRWELIAMLTGKNIGEDINQPE